MSEPLHLCVVRAGQCAPHDQDVVATEPFPAAFQQVVHRILPCGFEPCAWDVAFSHECAPVGIEESHFI